MKVLIGLSVLFLLSAPALADPVTNDDDLIDQLAQAVATVSMPMQAHQQMQSLIAQFKQQSDTRAKAREEAAKAKTDKPVKK